MALPDAVVTAETSSLRVPASRGPRSRILASGPVEGVALKTWAAAQAALAGGKDLAMILGKLQIDNATWDRVSAEWMARMSRDTTATVATEYGMAFSNSGEGMFSDAAAQGIAGMGNPGAVDKSKPPITLEQWVELMEAQGAAATQGRDAMPFTFRALNVTCPHCTTVNGFEPGTRMRIGELCIHPLCEEAAWQQWVAMREAERAWRTSRGATIEILKAWERAQIAFWHAYLSARIRLMPETGPAFDTDLRGRMRHFYDQMEREVAWTRAGRPRDLV